MGFHTGWPEYAYQVCNLTGMLADDASPFYWWCLNIQALQRLLTWCQLSASCEVPGTDGHPWHVGNIFSGPVRGGPAGHCLPSSASGCGAALAAASLCC